MRNTKKASLFRKQKSKRKSKKRFGGDSTTNDNITNIDISIFLFGLLQDSEFKTYVLDKNNNRIFLNTITYDKMNEQMDSNSPQYKNFANDMLYWLVVVNKYFLQSLLTLFYNSINDKDFFTSNNRSDIITNTLYTLLSKETNSNNDMEEIKKNNILLKIMYLGLTTMPDNKTKLKDIVSDVETIDDLKKDKEAINCILDYLIPNIHNNDKQRRFIYDGLTKDNNSYIGYSDYFYSMFKSFQELVPAKCYYKLSKVIFRKALKKQKQPDIIVTNPLV
jgi:hypothetical protein